MNSTTRRRFDLAVVATHVAPAKGYGGVAVSAAQLVRNLFEADSTRRIVLCSSDGSMGAPLQASDIKVGNGVSVRLYRTRKFPRWGFGLGAVPALFSVCRSSNVIYICGISTWPTTLAAWLCILLRRPFIIAPRGGLMPEHVEHIHRHRLLKWWFYRLLTFPTVRRARAVHCTSELEADGVKAILDTGPIFVVPNFTEIDAHHDVSQDSSPLSAGLRICYVGRLSPEKGINPFIKTWLSCRRAEDHLLVAGDGEAGPYFSEFLQLVEQANGSIEYLGYLNKPQLAKTIAQCHFLALPSGLGGDVRENFGNAVVEALALGRPAIVTRGLSWDALDRLGAGFCFDRNTASLAAVLARAMSIDQPAWNAMCNSAHRYAQDHFDGRMASKKIWEMLTAPAPG